MMDPNERKAQRAEIARRMRTSERVLILLGVLSLLAGLSHVFIVSHAARDLWFTAASQVALCMVWVAIGYTQARFVRAGWERDEKLWQIISDLQAALELRMEAGELVAVRVHLGSLGDAPTKH
jgi:hypothetical protein